MQPPNSRGVGHTVRTGFPVTTRKTTHHRVSIRPQGKNSSFRKLTAF